MHTRLPDRSGAPITSRPSSPLAPTATAPRLPPHHALPAPTRTLTTAPRDEAAELAEARRLLATAKTASTSGITFGGRIQGSTCNIGQALARYYDAVSIARSLSDVRALHGARLAFSHQVPLPDDLRAALRETLQLHGGLQRESAGMIGRQPAADGDEVRRAAVDPGAPFAPNDAAVLQFFAEDRDSLQQLLEAAPAHKALDVVRLFARGRELLPALDVATVGDWGAVAERLPATNEGGAVLLRLAHAFSVAPSSLSFAGGKLDSDALVMDGVEVARPLGTVSAPPTRIRRAVQRAELSDLALDDDSVLRLADAWSDATSWTQLLPLAPQDARLSVLRIVARALELDRDVSIPTDLPHVAETLTESSAGRQVLRRILRSQKKLSEDTVKALKAMLPAHYAPARRRHGASLSEPGPIGTRSTDGKTLEELAQQGADALLLSDTALATLHPDDLHALSKAHQDDPAIVLAVAKIFARAAETKPRSFNQRGMNLAWYGARCPTTPEALGVLLRAARASAKHVDSIDLGAHGRLVVDAAAMRPIHGELGTVDCTDPEALRQMLEKQDARLSALSDASVRALLEEFPMPTLWPAPVHVDAKGSAQRLALMIRGLDLVVGLEPSEVAKYIERVLHPRVAQDAEVMRWVAAFEARVQDSAAQADHPTRVASTASPHVWGPLLDAKAELWALASIATEPRKRAFDAVVVAPLGERIRDIPADWQARDPGLFTADDDSLAPLADNVDVGAWLEYWESDPRILRVAARCLEAHGADPAPVQEFLRRPLPTTLTDDAALLDVVRLARAAGVDAKDVAFAVPVGAAKTLADHPSYEALARPVTQKDIEARHAPYFDLLGPGSDAETRRSALLDLVSAVPVRERLEARPLLDAITRRRADETLAPVDAGATPEARKAYVAAIIRGVGHGGLGLLVAAAVTKDLDARDVSEVLESFGWPEDVAVTWSGIAATISETDPSIARSWLQPMIDGAPATTGDFATAMTLHTLGRSEREIRRALFSVEEEEPIEFLAAMLRYVQSDPTDDRRKIVTMVVRDVIEEGKLDPGQLDPQGRSDLLRLLDGTLEPRADKAIDRIASSNPRTRIAARKDLVDVLLLAAEIGDASDLFERSLRRVLQLDLDRTIPLDVANELIEAEGARPGAPSKHDVVVAGIPLEKNKRADRDLSAIPRAAHAELVMTPTTEANLRRLAVGWRNGQAVLLEGPTGAGKTAAVRYIAHLTETPYRRINLTYHTEVDDLIGRWVGGLKEYERADLEEMNAEALAALGVEYGVEPGADRGALVEAVLAAQDKPRWVDGPLIQAMRKGEVLLLDEINLARPEVLERLNSLLDGDGNIVLTEHGNEVITPAPEFRIVATMNPATYSGRGDLSDAFRSRWNTVFTHGLDEADIRMVVADRYGDSIPADEAIKLIKVHEALARDADAQAIGRASGGVAYTLRNLFRVTDRFLRYRGRDLDDAALLRRETEEVYLGGLFDEGDVAHVRDVLDAVMPHDGAGFYDDLAFSEDAHSVTIGDVVLAKVNADEPTVPSEASRLVLTRRTREVMYRLAKAMDMGENAALIGERASGKTAVAKMMAMLLGQPYARQNLNGGTDSQQLIGGYGPHGWEDGLIAAAGRAGATPSVVVLDEYNLGAPAVVERLNSLFDDERKLVLAEKAPPEEIRFGADIHFIATFNPPTRKYAGRSKLSPAAMNRFSPIWVPSLEDRDEQLEIMKVRAKQHGVDHAVAEALVDFHQWVAEGYESGELGKNQSPRLHPVYSVRTLEKAIALVGDLEGDLGLDGAYLAAVESLYGASADAGDSARISLMAREIAA